jgi:hypothetical protein
MRMGMSLLHLEMPDFPISGERQEARVDLKGPGRDLPLPFISTKIDQNRRWDRDTITRSL